MNVHFKTNLDWYSQIIWPIFNNVVPRKGEYVRVPEKYEPFCRANRIPQVLEVVDVVYHEAHVVVELWYRQIDIKSATTQKDRDHLYKQ